MPEKKIIVDVEVDTKSAAKNIDALNKKVETSIGEFDNLNEAISKTQDTLGKIDPKSAQFKELSKELAGLKDRLKDTEVQSVRFTEALASQPGVVGLVGQSIEGLRGTLKVFMANPIIAVVAGLAGAFLALRESLTKTTEGQETLNRISAAFGKIIGPVMAIIEKVALPIFEKFADLLGFVAEGFNKFAKFLGVSQSKIEEASRNSSEVLQKAYDEENKRQEDQTKKQEEESKKRLEDRKKALEEQKRLLDEANKVLDDAYKQTLSDRDRELYEATQKLNADILTLDKAGVEDKTLVQQSYREKIAEINKKYDDEELTRQQEATQKLKDEQEKALQDRLSRESQARADKAALIMADYNLQVSMGNQSFEEELKVFDKVRELEREEMVAKMASADALIAFDKETAATRTEIEIQQQQAKLAVISDALGTLAQAVGENTVAGKALAIAQATINTYQGASLALATYPPPFGAIAAATVIAAGLLNVKKIVSTKVPAPPGTSLKGGGSGGGSAPNITAPSIPSIATPEFQSGGGINATSQIGQTIAAAQKPLKAYVVSSDVQSAAALERRTLRAATFSGG